MMRAFKAGLLALFAGAIVVAGFSAPSRAASVSSTASPKGTPSWNDIRSQVSQATYETETATYNLGETAFKVNGFPGPIELQGVVHYPKAPAGKKLPLVVFLHGRHETCGRGQDSDASWPCRSGWKPIPSFRGYDYLGKSLASRGFIVVSIGANGINAADAESNDSGMKARGLLIQKHLDLWNAWATKGTGPFGARFKDAIDFQRVGTMGHSRGGEGVLANLSVNHAAPKPYGIKAVFPLAPTDFYRRTAVGVPLGVILPTCDGDVYDLQGQKIYDDTRYLSSKDKAPKHTATMSGANHNFFNVMWSPSSGQPGAWDDWYNEGTGGTCNRGTKTRLSESRQRYLAQTYIGGFFQLYLQGNKGFRPLWRGEVGPPQTYARVAVSYHAPTVAGPWSSVARRDINRLTTQDELKYNTLGGVVNKRGFVTTKYCGGPKPQPIECLEGAYDGALDMQPHATDPWFQGKPGMSILETAWEKPGAVFANELPAGKRDLARYDALRFRAVWDFSDARNSKDPRKFRVELVDTAGRSASVDPVKFGIALDYPELVLACGEDGCQNAGWRRYHLQQVRIPLSVFDGVDLGDVRWVRFTYDGASKGVLGLTDLALTD